MSSKKEAVTVLYNGSKLGTSSKLMNELAIFINEKYAVYKFSNEYRRGFLKPFDIAFCLLRPLKSVIRSRAVICHSYALLSVFSILLAKILGKKTVVISWDAYPTTINGVRLKRSWYRSLFDFLESRVCRIADVVVLPSADFEKWYRGSNYKVMPLWNVHKINPVKGNEFKQGKPINIIFSGHLDEVRGLASLFEYLSVYYRDKFIFHHAGPGDIERYKKDCSVKSVSHGNLSAKKLDQLLKKMDAGLVSLDRQLDQPGFPSKTFDYLASGLPIVYFGPKLNGYLDIIDGVYIDLERSDRDIIESELRRVISCLDENRERVYIKTSLKWENLDSIL